jgi:hypothetical protein
MHAVPQSLMSNYCDTLKNRGIPLAHFEDYKKWLRYFFDFCVKYPAPDKSEQVRLFLEKLQSKNQSASKRLQAAHVFRQALKKDFGDLPDVPRAKKSLNN